MGGEETGSSSSQQSKKIRMELSTESDKRSAYRIPLIHLLQMAES